jgi:3-phenylpropionate/trans-cinnamate dioxygenase ferredoxin subunit
MTNWTDVGPAVSLSEGEPLHVDFDGLSVAVFEINGSLLAIEDVCSHDRNPISEGCIENDQIICPRHGARFCLRTGRALTAPAYEDIQTFAVKREAGRLWIGFID